MSQHRPGAQYGASFLSLLRTEERQRLIDAGTVRQVADGAEIYVQDHRSAKIVILLTASARVLRDGAWVAYRGPGDILGELSSSTGSRIRPRSRSSGRAVSPCSPTRRSTG